MKILQIGLNWFYILIHPDITVFNILIKHTFVIILLYLYI